MSQNCGRCKNTRQISEVLIESSPDKKSFYEYDSYRLPCPNCRSNYYAAKKKEAFIYAREKAAKWDGKCRDGGGYV